MNRIILALLLTLLLPAVMSAQWHQTAGPYGGAAHAFAVSDTVVYTATTAGVFRSTDRGANWERIGTDLPSLRITAIHVDGRRIVVGSANPWSGGIFLSEDGGATFRRVSSQISGSIHKLDSTYFANAGYNGIYRSTDNGVTWSPTSTSLPGGTSVTDFIRIGNAIVAGTRGFGSIRSTDEGRTWSLLSNDVASITDFLQVGGRILAGTVGGLLSSTDGGATWARYGQNLPGSQVVWTLEQRGAELFAGTDSAVYRSTDQGATWAPAGGRIVTGGAVHDLSVIGGRLLAATDRSVYLLDPVAGAWRESSGGIIGTYVDRLTAAGGIVFALGSMSTDGGESWTPLAAEIPGLEYVSGAVATSLGTLIGTNAGLYLRSAAGTWSRVQEQRFATDSLEGMISYDGTVIAAFSRGVFRSDDGGATWRPTTGVAGMPGLVIPTALAVDDDYVYMSISGYYPGFYRMEHADSAWIGISSTSVSTLSSVGNELLGIYGTYYSRSTDRGESWAIVENAPRSYYAGPASLAAGRGMLAAGLLGQYDFLSFGRDSAAWISFDKGRSWYIAGQGLPAGQGVFSLVFDGDWLYAGLPTGVWKRSVSELLGLAAVPRDPVAGESGAGFVPNPFTGAATLRLAAEVTDGELRLVDMLGREVARRGGLSGSCIELDRGEIPSGVYHCTLRARGVVIWRGRLVAR